MKKILLIEDDADIRETLEGILDLEGYEVATAANGQPAIELLQRGYLPHLILLDLMMPVMDGREFLRRKTDLALATEVPIFVLSAGNRPPELPATILFVIKPMNLESLLSDIRQICQAA